MERLLKDKKRIVVKLGSSSLTYANTGKLALGKLEYLVRELADLKNQGYEIVLVSSGAIAVGAQCLSISSHNRTMAEKQACAAVGQGLLMMNYFKLFSEYGYVPAQVLLTKYTMEDSEGRENAINTFNELLNLGCIPIVNENDTVTTCEIKFGDNDSLSAMVAGLVKADLLIILSDIDGLYTADPSKDSSASLISYVDEITDNLKNMASDNSSSGIGTGGMATKLMAAKLASEKGIDTIIASSDEKLVLSRIMAGEDIGTYFKFS